MHQSMSGIHPFHLLVRSCFDELASVATQFVFAPECGGPRKLPLYPADRARKGAAYCCVDGLGVRDHVVTLVVEIEERKVPKPAEVFGKFYPVAHSTHYIPSRNETPIPLS